MIVNRVNTRAGRGAKRPGTAMVELACVLPILVTIVFGTIEVCQLIYLKQSLALAAYEAARVAIRRDATPALVTAKAENIAAARKVVNASVVVSPAGMTGLTPGMQVQVAVSAPWRENYVTRFVLIGDFNVSATMTMLVE
jgi:Flp pilus assembly protein TadG